MIRIGIAQGAIIALVLATAAIHVSRALANPHISALFTLNALGYLSLAAGLYAPWPGRERWHSAIRRILLAYTALTFALFFVWGTLQGEWPTIGFVDKAIEVSLIALLWREERARTTSVGSVRNQSRQSPLQG
jgi:hypothetical protein